MKTRMALVMGICGFVVIAGMAWAGMARADYESAPYTVVETDDNIEIREYPDLVVASTKTAIEARGNDGSFMRLFRYISGNNESSQKIAMTTPVFMEEGDTETMDFVMPKDVADAGAPAPASPDVSIRTRKGGRFVAIRFSGVMDTKKADLHEAKAREWIAARGLEAEDTAERAGYDAPYIPGFLRRNEVLIRLKPSESDAAAPLSND